jgi:hypothetical protein
MDEGGGGKGREGGWRESGRLKFFVLCKIDPITDRPLFLNKWHKIL